MAPASLLARRRMGACETTPPQPHAGNTTRPFTSQNRKGLFPAPDDPPPLVSVQLVRPRRSAAAGAPAGPLPHGGVTRAAARKIPENSQAQPGRHHASHRVKTPCPLDASGPHGCRREHPPGLLVQVGDGGVNCVGSWSCVRRAGIPRSLLSPPGEAPWPSGPMDHGVQRRERGGGQAGGPAARPELAVPSAAAVPKEISTCSASLLFGLSNARAAPATSSSFARLLRCVQRPAGQRLCGSRARSPGATPRATP